MIGSGVVCGTWYIPENSLILCFLFLKNNFLIYLCIWLPYATHRILGSTAGIEATSTADSTKPRGKSLFLLFIITILVKQTCLQDAKIQR